MRKESLEISYLDDLKSIDDLKSVNMRNQNYEGCSNDSLEEVCSQHAKLSQQSAWTTNQIISVKIAATFRYSKSCT